MNEGKTAPWYDQQFNYMHFSAMVFTNSGKQESNYCVNFAMTEGGWDQNLAECQNIIYLFCCFDCNFTGVYKEGTLVERRRLESLMCVCDGSFFLSHF